MQCLRRNYLPHQNLSAWHYLTPIRQRDHVLTIPAPPPTEQRYLGIRDLVMGSDEIPVVVQLQHLNFPFGSAWT